MNKTALVITSIAGDQHPVLNLYAKECTNKSIKFIMIGDSKSPATFKLDGCDFYPLDNQKSLSFRLAKITPERHYSRKNLGYLLAMREGCNKIIETDDDNYPYDSFWTSFDQLREGRLTQFNGWLNVYKYFADDLIWPRGLPLENIRDPLPEIPAAMQSFNAPVQQGLSNENPDVDAVYRLTFPLPFNFKKGDPVVLGKGTWCPFNSQNTVWFPDAFPLLYLPSYCSFRMTDIWRSYVTQRICWEYGWHILFHEATVWQERNDHSLLKDFEDEIPGYVNNAKIASVLNALTLSNRKDSIIDNLKKCYAALIDIGVIGKEEMNLLEAWCFDLKSI